MVTPEIISYVKSERSKNTPDPAIKSSLISNGWSESDIAEAMSLLGAPVDLEKHRKKILWDTFAALVGLDILIIVAAKLIYGTWGLFGISPLSILGRVLVIYLIASFSSRGSSPGKNTPKTVTATIFRLLGSVVVAIVIFVGLLYIYCLFITR